MRALLYLLLALALPLRAAEFTPVKPGVQLQFPRDFGAHPGFKTEWWYATGWLSTPDGRQLGYQVTFFRSSTGHGRDNPSKFSPKDIIVAHVALSDPAEGKLLHDQRTVRAGFGLAGASTEDTDLRLDSWSMRRSADGAYQLDIDAAEFTFALRLQPTQPVLLQGEAGYSRKGPQPSQASYYYSKPQLRTSGTVARRGAAPQAVQGVTWLDHEWSSQVLDPGAAGWDWTGINLADGGALMAFQIRDLQGGKLWAHATWRDASGKITHYSQDQVSFTPQVRWRSPRTHAEYPVAIQIATGSERWLLSPLQRDQEMDSRRSTGGAYWEGAVTVEREGKPAGRGYLELTGYVRPMKL
ncbi:lipocalin-like domain-containing protein [Pseudoduganella violaceinigra]|uniref:lipocalin-like domain-containing protein n=1 Tax=Pseudoduganella violaceinigra TaxID=246602 RepID=UPI00040C0B77|nr:carotenoid 1,2-hydratase [Pseudoduganella violaceinigra]